MIKTSRLILRPWQENDLKLFAQLNADPQVMEYFPSVKNLEESIMNDIEKYFQQGSVTTLNLSLIRALNRFPHSES